MNLLGILRRLVDEADIDEIMKFESKMNLKQVEMCQHEIFITYALIQCLRFMKKKSLNIWKFCRDYDINYNKMLLRLKHVGIKFEKDEIKNLVKNNIINKNYQQNKGKIQ